MRAITRSATGSAHRGLGEWLLVRVTAVYLALFVPWMWLRLPPLTQGGHEPWFAWFERPLVRTTVWLAVVAVALHAWLGLRAVSQDYLKQAGLRASVQAGLALLFTWLVAYAGMTLFLAGL